MWLLARKHKTPYYWAVVFRSVEVCLCARARSQFPIWKNEEKAAKSIRLLSCSWSTTFALIRAKEREKRSDCWLSLWMIPYNFILGSTSCADSVLMNGCRSASSNWNALEHVRLNAMALRRQLSKTILSRSTLTTPMTDDTILSARDVLPFFHFISSKIMLFP